MNGQHNKKEGILFRHLFLDFKFVGADQRRRTPPQLSIRRFTSK